MSVIRFYHGFDMRFFENSGTSIGDPIRNGTISEQTATSWIVSETGGEDRFAGESLGGLNENMPTTGTVTGWDHLADLGDGLTTIWSFSGFAVSASTFSGDVLNDNVDTLLANNIMVGADTVYGSAENDYLLGYLGNDTLLGGAGNDTLDAGNGNDTMYGGQGNDVFVVDSILDFVSDDIDSTGASGSGIDEVRTTISFSLDETERLDIENLTSISSGNVDLYGHSGNNQIRGNAGNDRLHGGGGNDLLDGGAGDDTAAYWLAPSGVTVNLSLAGAQNTGGAGTDTLVSIEWLSGSTHNDTLTGNSFRNTIAGNEGNDVIRGAAGEDVLAGGVGNDTIDGGADDDQIDGEDGTDTVSYASAAGAVTVDLSVVSQATGGAGNDTLFNIENATGSAFNDTLAGNDNANVLNGGAGADALAGRGGADTYVVDNVGDTVVEAAGGGIDRVLSSVDFVLGDHVERLTLIGSGATNALGNNLANLIIGNNASNVIDGGAGADEMRGQGGDDYYIVDDAADAILELAGQGSDTVRTSLATYSIASLTNVEDLIGDSPFQPTEYDLNPASPVDQELTGNALANLIDGGRGADRMVGALGDDSYVVDNSGDLTIEGVGEGVDSVRALINWTLAPNVENLVLIVDVDFGIYAANGSGNALDNIIEGNHLNNILNGGAGADVLRGYTGNDIYVVDNVGDVIVESTAPGVTDTDLVKSSISFTLGAQLENLTLLGTNSLAGTGNSKNNVLVGNSGDNVLRGAGGDDVVKGGAGDDVLKGGLGDDRLTGGAGIDKFLFDSALSADNVDRILDYNLTEDCIVLDDDIFTAAGAVGGLSANAFRAGTTAQDADDRVIYDSATGRIYYDADGAGGAAQVLFAKVSAGLALDSGDFIIGA